MNDWPDGWYRDDRPRRAGGGRVSGAPGGRFASRYSAGAGQASRAGNWPSQPPPRTAPGRGSPEGPAGGWRPPRSRQFGPKRITQLVAAFVVLVIVLAVGFYFYLNARLTHIPVLADYPGRPTAGAGQNWLLTGSDSRGGMSTKEEDELALGHDVGGARSDTIMILHIPASGPPVLVSIPRDSYVPIPGHGYNKINAAYALGGPKLLAETVQNATGLYMNHYMGIGVAGLAGVVDDVGGVHMCVPGRMVDPKAGLNLQPGCQNLSGPQALGYVRTRAFSNGDLQREQDQRLLLKALLSKVTSAGTLANPFATVPAAAGAVKSVDVDQGTQLYQLVSVAFALRNPETTTVPTAGFAAEAAGSVVVWNHTEARQLFDDLANDTPVPKSLLSGSSAVGTS